MSVFRVWGLHIAVGVRVEGRSGPAGCLAAPQCSLWSVTVLTACGSQFGTFSWNYKMIKIIPSNTLLYLVPSLSVSRSVSPEIPSKDHVYFSHWFTPRASDRTWFYCCLTRTDLGKSFNFSGLEFPHLLFITLLFYNKLIKDSHWLLLHFISLEKWWYSLAI